MPESIVASRLYEVFHQGKADPAEEGRDVMFVRATSARRAKVLFVRAWRRLQHRSDLRHKHMLFGHSDWLDEGTTPFRWITVKRLPPDWRQQRDADEE